MKTMSQVAKPSDCWIDEARQIAAQCWCDDETKDRVMDAALAEAVAQRIAAWMDTAAQAQRGVDYYRGLVVRCGNALGDAAKTCDDGSKSDDVLCAKVPELVEAAQSKITDLEDQKSRQRLAHLGLQAEFVKLAGFLGVTITDGMTFGTALEMCKGRAQKAATKADQYEAVLVMLDGAVDALDYAKTGAQFHNAKEDIERARKLFNRAVGMLRDLAEKKGQS